jgi:predicted RNA binding protein YcfA (HicA-like mRNA interferase family)
MPKLPVLSALEVIKALSKFGYEFDHQKGSHIVLRQTNSRVHLNTKGVALTIQTKQDILGNLKPNIEPRL